MSNNIARENELSKIVIGHAIDIHRELGPGLLENAYKECLFYKLRAAKLFVEKEKAMPLIYHDVNSKEELDFVGETPTYCTPVHVNSAFLNSEIKIGLGTIRSNIYVGATGGRMSVIPHSAGLRSITRNAKLQATHPIGPFLIDSAGSTDLLEASQLAGLDFIINAIPDYKSNIYEIVAGNPYSSWTYGEYPSIALGGKKF